jgi:hypothetical protein
MCWASLISWGGLSPHVMGSVKVLIKWLNSSFRISLSFWDKFNLTDFAEYLYSLKKLIQINHYVQSYNCNNQVSFLIWQLISNAFFHTSFSIICWHHLLVKHKFGEKVILESEKKKVKKKKIKKNKTKILGVC